MVVFRYRAIGAGGAAVEGRLEADDAAQARARVRRLGIAPVEIAPASMEAVRAAGAPAKAGSKARRAVAKTLGELAVLLRAGLPLDRALALAIENVEDTAARRAFLALLEAVREGTPLARAMARQGALFSSMAQAMIAAGEANGRLAEAVDRLAVTLERQEELRQLIGTAMIYPIMLLGIATGVILLMLLFVVPQFEALFATAQGPLPPASRAVMTASRLLRDHGLALLAALVGIVLLVRQILRRPGNRRTIDRLILRAPQIGAFIAYAQTAIFARIMAVLVDGGVPLPDALALAQRSLTNTHMAGAIGKVAGGLREGGGLTAPLAAAGILPRLAIGFLRTGEETSELGTMLARLADVLDREVRVRLQRLIGIITPMITVVLGAVVAGIIAAIMSAILGFNDLAVAG